MTDSITVTDNRSGESLEIPIIHGGVAAHEFSKVVPGVWFYDPGFMATAAAESSITYLDGDAGILRYRGYPIEQLAEHSTYLEVAYLLLYGELPTAEQALEWEREVTYHTYIHENVRKRFLEGFNYDAHPMGMLVSAIAALSTYYKEAKDLGDAENLHRQIVRLIAKMPTLAAACHRFSVGMPFVYPDNSLGYTQNFLSMMWKVAEPRYAADPILSRALEVLFILHADHEQNCGTTAMRTVASSHGDPYVGDRRGDRRALRPASRRGQRGRAQDAGQDRVDRERPGVHRDRQAGSHAPRGVRPPRLQELRPAREIIKKTADEVFTVTGKNPLLDIALKLEEIALRDDYFISRKLYPNVDFYSGLIYQAMGFPLEMFTGPLRHPAHVGLAGALQGAARPGPQDRPAPPALRGHPRRATTCR